MTDQFVYVGVDSRDIIQEACLVPLDHPNFDSCIGEMIRSDLSIHKVCGPIALGRDYHEFLPDAQVVPETLENLEGRSMRDPALWDYLDQKRRKDEENEDLH